MNKPTWRLLEPDLIFAMTTLPTHAVVSDSASMSGGCVGTLTLDQVPSETVVHAFPSGGKSDGGVSAVGEAIGPIGNAGRDSCGSNANLSDTVECTSGGVSGAHGCVPFGSVPEHAESDRISPKRLVPMSLPPTAAQGQQD